LDPAWVRLADHARRRHGTISWQAATALGIPGSTLTSWVTSGRLIRAAPGVMIIAGSPETWHQRVAVAAASGSGWASHRCAATLWRLDGFPPRQIEVLTLHGRRHKRTAWIVHESRVIRGVDLDDFDGIPCTSVVRTLLDLAAVAHPFLVGQALDCACRKSPGMLQAVDQRHVELARRGRRGTRLMRELLDERLGRGRFNDSGFETKALRLVRSVGLPEPVLQFEVHDGEFVVFLDLAWPDIKWFIECDSLANHFGKRAHEWDRARRRRLKGIGWDCAEVTYDQVTKDGPATGKELRQLYDLRRRSFNQDPAAT
jgi:Transcriptional regulator, AbiEi antitoxin